MSELRFSQTDSFKELPGDTYHLATLAISGLTDKISNKTAESSRDLEKIGILPAITMPEPPSNKSASQNELPGDAYNQTDAVKELPGDAYHERSPKSSGLMDKASTRKADLNDYLEKTGVLPPMRFYPA